MTGNGRHDRACRENNNSTEVENVVYNHARVVDAVAVFLCPSQMLNASPNVSLGSQRSSKLRARHAPPIRQT